MAQERTILKACLDLFVLLGVGLPLLVLYFWVEPNRRGYFPDDTSLRLPYKQQTISEVALTAAGFGLVIVTIFITEILRHKKGKSCTEVYLCNSLLPGWVSESYRTVGVFSFGAACTQLTANVAKYVIGRLRPHFFAVCDPEPVERSPLNSLGYIQDFTCRGTDTQLIKEMRLSFPSAHASFAMYTALFLVMYLQNKCKWRGSKLFRHGVQFAVFTAAWYVGLSRVVDHMHHWNDVAAGFIIGAVYGVLVFMFVLKPKRYGRPSSWQESTRQEHVLPRPVLSR